MHTFHIKRASRSYYHIIKNDDNSVIGHVSKSLKSFNIFINGVYWDFENNPNRWGGSIAAGVSRLMDAPDFIAKSLRLLEESDAKILSDKKRHLENLVSIDTLTASGAVLNWLVAKSLNLDVDVDSRGRCAAFVNGSRYDPLTDSVLVMHLAEKHIDCIRKECRGSAFSAATGPIVAYGDSISLACLRAFAAKELGKSAMVPACLVSV